MQELGCPQGGKEKSWSSSTHLHANAGAHSWGMREFVQIHTRPRNVGRALATLDLLNPNMVWG
jgi:hypothetical protein